eukprot:419697-Prorocentrum_minimum.AAC.4
MSDSIFGTRSCVLRGVLSAAILLTLADLSYSDAALEHSTKPSASGRTHPRETTQFDNINFRCVIHERKKHHFNFNAIARSITSSSTPFDCLPNKFVRAFAQCVGHAQQYIPFGSQPI